MTGKHLIASLTVGIIATGGGCVSCKHSAFATSLKAYKDTGIPAPVRQRVYLFILNRGRSDRRGGVVQPP